MLLIPVSDESKGFTQVHQLTQCDNKWPILVLTLDLAASTDQAESTRKGETVTTATTEVSDTT